MIVTATGSGGNPYAFCTMKVLVLTNATEQGGASASVQASPAQVSVTPVASNSLICSAAENETTNQQFAVAVNNVSDSTFADAVTGTAYMQGRYAGSVASGTPVTVGTSAPSGGLVLNIAAYEIRTFSGTTPVIDLSSPAAVSANSPSVSTANFSPPSNSVIVALVSTPGGSSAGYNLAVADNTGLVWTRRSFLYAGINQGYVGIFTATTATPQQGNFSDAAINSVLDKIVSYAMASGRFDAVNQHEPKNAPGNQITFAVWVQSIKPVPRGSGLSSTSGVILYTGRIYQNFKSQPFDAIDPNVTAACTNMMGALSGDFNFGGVGGVRSIDLLGMYGTSLSAAAGYVEIDKTIYRVMTIQIPIIINDMFAQVA